MGCVQQKRVVEVKSRSCSNEQSNGMKAEAKQRGKNDPKVVNPSSCDLIKLNECELASSKSVQPSNAGNKEAHADPPSKKEEQTQKEVVREPVDGPVISADSFETTENKLFWDIMQGKLKDIEFFSSNGWSNPETKSNGVVLQEKVFSKADDVTAFKLNFKVKVPMKNLYDKFLNPKTYSENIEVFEKKRTISTSGNLNLMYQKTKGIMMMEPRDMTNIIYSHIDETSAIVFACSVKSNFYPPVNGCVRAEQHFGCNLLKNEGEYTNVTIITAPDMKLNSFAKMMAGSKMKEMIAGIKDKLEK